MLRVQESGGSRYRNKDGRRIPVQENKTVQMEPVVGLKMFFLCGSVVKSNSLTSSSFTSLALIESCSMANHCELLSQKLSMCSKGEDVMTEKRGA